MSVILLADLKSFIHMSEVFDDVLLQDIMDGVELDVSNNYLHSELAQVAGDVEYHDADRSNTIMLNNGLVTAIATVKLDSNGDFTYANTLTYQTDYIWYAVGYIQLLGSSIISTRRQQYIEVTYTHGYLTANIPIDLQINILKMMSNTYHGSLQVTEVEGSPKVFSQKEIDDGFAKYRRLVI